jgi:prepilin-type N-terminal cleavage/methylation domain-containing protein
MPRHDSGLSLIEIIAAIGVMGIIIAIVLVAVNPSRQFAQNNDTRRIADLTVILDSVRQYATDHKGKFPAAITTSTQSISNKGANICADISPAYIGLLPSDPTAKNNGVAINDCTSTYDTEYTIAKDSTGKVITVTAPNAQVTGIISITR